MKIHVIVNPKAGRQTVQKTLEQIVGKLVLEGIAGDVRVTRTKGSGDAMEAAASCAMSDTDLIIGCGGDGTQNEIINGIMRSGSRVPLAILAAGTSNDFAASMHLPETAESFGKMIKDGCYRPIDIGLVNGKDYFLNVASFGMFTSVAHTTDRNAKNNLGRMAYYLKAASNAPMQFKQYAKLKITSDGQELCGEYALCIVGNSTSIGSFRKLMHKADVSDGLFDVLLLKKPTISPAPSDRKDPPHITDPFRPALLKYIQTSDISFELQDNKNIEVDLDGEAYGYLPMSIKVCHNAIDLLVPAEPEDHLSLPLIR